MKSFAFGNKSEEAGQMDKFEGHRRNQGKTNELDKDGDGLLLLEGAVLLDEVVEGREGEEFHGDVEPAVDLALAVELGQAGVLRDGGGEGGLVVEEELGEEEDGGEEDQQKIDLL